MWSEYFAFKDDVVLDSERTFQVYRSKKSEKGGPLLLLLHGGGYSGLTWANFCVRSQIHFTLMQDFNVLIFSDSWKSPI